MRAIPFALAVLVGAGISDARADVRLDYHATSDDAPLTRLEISGPLMRSDSGEQSVIVDTAKNEFLTIDRANKEFTRIDIAEMEKLAGAASAAMQQAQAMLKNLPPEQREMIEERMGGHLPGMAPKTKVTMTATGKHDTVAGHPCKVFAMQVNGSHDQDVCLASANEIGLGATDQKTLHDAFAFFKRMAQKFSAGTSGIDLPFDQLGEGLVPVKLVVYDNGKTESTSALKSIGTVPLPASDFMPPSGFREKKMDLKHLGG
ncbi:MAG: DUF4412 domain-containing protein [Rhodanobacteraceae bacterium]